MDKELAQKITDNARKSASHSETYDEMWHRVGIVDPNEGYAKVRWDFIDYVIKKYIRMQTDLQILDLGCGMGWLTAILARYGQATGIDFAPEAIKAAQEIYGSQIRYLVADSASQTLGLPSDTMFDLVVTSEVIEHVEDQIAFLGQIAAFVKPEGWLILTTPNRRFWNQYVNNERFKIWGQPIENWLTTGECRRLLENGGFDVLWREGWPDSGGYTLLNKLADSRIPRRLTKLLGIYHLYARLLLPVSTFQMIFARRKAA